MSFAKLAAEIWRLYVTDGVPASGAHNPVKTDVQAWGLEVETQLAARGLVLLDYGTVASAATLDIDITSYTAYRGVKIVVDSLVPATDDVDLYLTLSTDSGSTFASTSYKYGLQGMRSNSDTAIIRRGEAASQCIIAGLSSAGDSMSNLASDGGAHVEIDWLTHLGTARNPRLFVRSNWYGANSDAMSLAGHAGRSSGSVHNALRLACESGNITSARWAIYGWA